MRKVFILTVIGVVSLTGCKDEEQAESQQQLQSAQQELQIVEAKLQKMADSISSCQVSIRDLEKDLGDANFHIDHVPKLRVDLESGLTKLAKLEKLSDKTADLLQVASRQGDRLVVRGIVVADQAGNVRCLMSKDGLAISDESGSRVCEIQYDEQARAMSAKLKGGKQNSVALYAGEDRAAIGAYDARGKGLVGWAATVTHEGQVTAGKARR